MRGGLFNEADIALRLDLISEEFGELQEAIFSWNMAETMDGKVSALIDIADALADLDYVVNGAFVAFGLPGTELCEEVHRSNMTKLDRNGDPILREDGKVLKSDLYEPPQLMTVLIDSGHLKADLDEGDEIMAIYMSGDIYA